MAFCVIMRIRAIKKQAVGLHFPKGGEVMSAFEIVMIILTAMALFIALIKLIIYIADTFLKKK